MIKKPHPELVRSIEKRCGEIVPRLEVRDSSVQIQPRSRGPKPVVTLKQEDLISMKPLTTRNHLNQVIGATCRGKDGDRILDGLQYEKIIRLSADIIEKLGLRGIVSKQLVQEVITDWVFDHDPGFSEGVFAHLVETLEREIKAVEVDLPLSGVNGDVELLFCGVRFGPQSLLLKTWLEGSQKFKAENDLQRQGIDRKCDEIRKAHGESFWASYSVTADSAEGERIARASIAEATDLFRAFCAEGYHPLRYVGLVAGRRSRDASFACKAVGPKVSICEAVLEGQQQLWIDEDAINFKMMIGLGKAAQMYSKEIRTDMEEVVLTALRELGKVSGLSDLSDKLVYGCTALEQVFLKDQTEPILASMPNRVAMLMEDELADRKKLIKTVKACYSFRSRRVHHGVEVEVSDEICDFFKLLWLFVVKLVRLPDSFKTKQELLTHLDDRLLAG
jgi:hypothetical protein